MQTLNIGNLKQTSPIVGASCQHRGGTPWFYPRSIVTGLSFLLLMATIFAPVASAQINPVSAIQVPLPKAFGEPGSVRVTESIGAVSDSINIELAPGRRGMKPRLSLSYSSMGGNGLAGLGWSLGGGGSIERWRGDGTPSVKVLTFNSSADDRYSYSLAGASGELHDENGDGVYRARIETVYRPFRKVGSGWQMYDGQGVSYTFGTTDDSRIDGELWLLDRVEDPSGNTIIYRYGTECDLGFADCNPQSQTLYPRTIYYTGYSPYGDLGSNQIIFEYEQRPDRRLSYRRGVREEQNFRLRQVSVMARGDLVRRYRLAYDQYASGPSLLASVVLVGADDVSELTLRSLEYSERAPGWPGSVGGPLDIPVGFVDITGQSTGAHLVDVNGDGFADLVTQNGRGGARMVVYLGNGQGGFEHSTPWRTALNQVTLSRLVDGDGHDTGVRFLDVNADARPDIIIAQPNLTEVWLHTGSGWQQSDAWTESLQDLTALQIPLDDDDPFDDELPAANCQAAECFTYGGTNNQNPPAGCHPFYCGPGNGAEDCLTECTGSDSDPFGCVEDNLPECGEDDDDPIFGDSPDPESFAVVGSNGEYNGVEFGDINGDGLIDIVWSLGRDTRHVFDEDSSRVIRAIFLNGGDENPGWHTAFGLSTALAKVLTNEDDVPGIGDVPGAFVMSYEYKGYALLDVNGDHLADIVRSIVSEDGIFQQAVYLGDGTGWKRDAGYSQSMRDNSIYSVNFGLMPQFVNRGLMPMDFNGDGLMDYIQARSDTFATFIEAWVNTGTGWVPDDAMASALANSGLTFVNGEGKATGVVVSDIDGNGVSDLVMNLIQRSAGDQEDIILLGDTLRSGKLLRSVNALGQVAEISWLPSSAFDHQTPAGIEGMPISLTLVDTLSTTDGRGNTFHSQLDYSGGLYTASGFRGFKTVRHVPSSGLTKVTQYYQDEERASQPFEISTYDSAGTRRSLSTSDTIVEDAEPGVRQLLLKETRTKRFSAAGILTNESLVVRNYNGFMQATSVFSDAAVEKPGNERTAEYAWLENVALGFWGLMEKVTAKGPSGEFASETITQYDARGLPIEIRDVIDASNYVSTSLQYDQFGNATRVTDRNGNATTFLYDTVTSTFRVQATDPLGRVMQSEFDPGFGTLIRDVDASGNATTTSYDAFGGKVRVVAPGDESSPFGTVTYDYANIGDPQQQFLRIRRTEHADTSDIFETTSFFDAVGRTYETREEGPGGLDVVTQVEFGEDGLPSASSLPFYEGYAPEFILGERDDLGRIVAITDPLGQTLSMSYEGFTVNFVDGRGNTTTSTSNPAGLPVEIIERVDGALRTTRYEYNGSGQLTKLIDALGSETNITYDALGRRTMLDDPNAGMFQYKHDNEGRIIEKIGPDGKSILSTYSAAGELIEKRLPDGTQYTFRYGGAAEPNGVGRLVEVQDASGTLNLSYDARGRMIERRRAVEGKTYVTGFRYDSMDRVTEVIYPDGFLANYAYDSGDNLAAVTDRDGRPIAEGFQYNAARRITEFQHGNGVTTDYTYDILARMLSTRSSTGVGIDLQELNYTFDAANNVLSMNDLTSRDSHTFEYDEANRLVRAVGPYGEEEYEYDAIGNLLKKGNLHFAHDPLRPQRVTCGVEVLPNIGGGNSNAAGIDPCAQSLASVDGAQVKRAFAIEYDDRGNMIAKGSRRYEYDAENRLIGAHDLKNNHLLEQNRYDWSGQLIVKQGKNEKTVYIDGLYEESETRVSRHIRAGSLLLATVSTKTQGVELIAQAHPWQEQQFYQAGVPGASLFILLFYFYRVLGSHLRKWLTRFSRACRSQPMSVGLIILIVCSTWTNSGYAGPSALPGLTLGMRAPQTKRPGSSVSTTMPITWVASTWLPMTTAVWRLVGITGPTASHRTGLAPTLAPGRWCRPFRGKSLRTTPVCTTSEPATTMLSLGASRVRTLW
jgi:YD repeat-containing protein